MSETPEISIITVCFNAEIVLERTIMSIADQTFRNFEYIIIDGGSVDGTSEIIGKNKEFINKWISEPDKGLYDAMNKGLKMAKGRYIWFLNAGDEIYSRDTIEKLTKITGNSDVIYSDTLVVDLNGKEIGLLSKLTHNNAPENLSWENMEKGMVVCHQSFIVKKEIAPNFDLKYKYSSDIDWVIQCLKNATQKIKTEFILAKFLKAGLSKQKLNTSMKERYQILNKHFGFWTNLWNHLYLVCRYLSKGWKSEV